MDGKPDATVDDASPSIERVTAALDALCYHPRDGDSIRITIDPDGQHYAVYGAYEDGKPYRGHGDFHADAGAIRFDTWHPYDPDA